jgi:hypothetical protein
VAPPAATPSQAEAQDTSASAVAAEASDPASAAVEEVAVPPTAAVEESPKTKPPATGQKTPKQRTPTAAAVVAEPVPAVPLSPGVVQLAISPWGQIEVDGKFVGLAPPMNHVSLPGGSHTITIRNGDFPPLVRQVEVSADRPVVIKHRFE